MADEQAFHDQLDTAASEALTMLTTLMGQQKNNPTFQRDIAQFILRLHLDYHTGVEVLDEQEDVGVEVI